MKIAVCVKIIDGELNPFDECALEEALRIQDAEVYVVSMCPESAKDKLLSLTRLGVKKVFLLSDKAFAGSDTLATAYILSLQIKKLNCDMVFCGRQTIDGDTAQVGPSISVKLGFNLITNVMEIKSVEGKVSCVTRFGDETAELPSVLTIERINKLRFPSIFSRTGEIEIVNNSKLQADTDKIGLKGSPTRVLKSFENSSGQRRCTFISPSEFDSVLQKALKADDVSELRAEGDKEKLKSVWAVGKETAEIAKSISEEVILKEMQSPFEFAEQVKSENPQVILFPADLLGRKVAPQVASVLETGLCADCTLLEAENGRLMMYRPAKGGNITAKICCSTNPQMATVRCSQKSDDIIISGGRGVGDKIEELKKLAQNLGGDLCCSRALVDKDVLSYEHQVGLTGKSISPKVYIAIGISGAIQHMCAIENSKTVIAVNPDRDADVFKYADYGIVCSFEEFINIVLKK